MMAQMIWIHQEPQEKIRKWLRGAMGRKRNGLWEKHFIGNKHLFLNIIQVKHLFL